MADALALRGTGKDNLRDGEGILEDLASKPTNKLSRPVIRVGE